MRLYRYEAIDSAGRVVRGAMNAGDEQQVAQRLSQMGYSTRAVHPASPQSSSTRKPQPGAAPHRVYAATSGAGVPVSVKSRVSPRALAEFFRHAATLVRSGMPLVQALHEMSSVTRDRRLKAALTTLQQTTQTGQSLSGVMARFPNVFPVHAIASVWAGELAGKLEIALDEVAADFEQEASDVRLGRIGWGLAKLSLISFILIIPVANIAALLTPALTATMGTGGGQMTPAQSLALVANTYLREMLWKSALGILALVAVWMVWGAIKRVPQVKRVLDGLLIGVPLWGPLHRDRALARFLHVLDGLHSAAVSPATAWDAASLTPRNSFIAEKLKLTLRELPPTASLSDALAASGVFAFDDIAMVVTGEKAGAIPDTLANLSARYADSAAGRRITGRTVSTSLLISLSLALGGYVVIRLVSSYFQFVFKATDIIGL